MTVQPDVSSRTPEPREYVPAFAQLLKSLILQRLASYSAADKLIWNDFVGGRHRGRGRPKLVLPLPKLAEHMAARDRRRIAQRELMLLVPVWRRLKAGLQQKDRFDPADSRTLHAIGGVLAPAAYAPSGKHTDIEKDLATLLLNSFACLFPLAPAPVSASKDPGTNGPTGYDATKTKLYQKIVSSGIMTGKEIAALRTIFWQ